MWFLGGGGGGGGGGELSGVTNNPIHHNNLDPSIWLAVLIAVDRAKTLEKL